MHFTPIVLNRLGKMPEGVGNALVGQALVMLDKFSRPDYIGVEDNRESMGVLVSHWK